MAPTFRPYQSVGQGLNQLNLPQGLEAQEAQRTMTVLSRSMDQMSSFFFKRAEDQARIEGAKFGVENAPDVNTLKNAFKEGKDTSDLLEFGNTVFGKSARESALRVLQNEVMIEGTRTINDLVFNASSNNTPPPTLQKQINASILGLSDAIRASSPELGEIIKSKLTMQGIGEFDRYRTAFAKGSVGTASATGRASVNEYLNALPSTLTAILNTENITPELFKARLENVVKTGLIEFTTNGYAKTQLETKINEQDKIIEDWFLSQFTQEVFDRDISEESAYTPQTLITQIQKGKYKGKDPQAKLIIDFMNLKDKGGVKVPTLNDLQKAIANNYTQKIALENQEINIGNKRLDEKKKAEVLILDNIFNKTDPLDDTDIANARVAIAKLQRFGFSDLADKYSETLEPLSVDNGFPPRSDGNAILEVETLIRTARINFGNLNRYRKQLTQAEYNKYFEDTVTSLDQRTQQAIDEIKVAVGMDYKAIVYGDLKDDAKYEYRKAEEAERKLKKAMLKSRREGTEVNPLVIVEDIIEEANFSISEDKRKDDLKKAIRSVNDFIDGFKKIKDTTFTEDMIRGATDEETVKNFKDLIEQWTEFTDFNQIPEMYRSLYMRELFNDDGNTWKENIERNIRKMEKGLPGG